MIKLEVCAGSYQSALAAETGGADRVELCVGLDEGGLTPSYGLIEEVMRLPRLKKHILIRPRGGDFLYTPEEKQIIQADIRMAAQLGADGIVVGALTEEGEIDLPFLKKCVKEAGIMSVTFHRAFDLCRDPFRALEEIIITGCDRILTSGQAATAEAGIGLLKGLIEQANGRIIVMPGSGVNSKNVAHILHETGATEIHASAREIVGSQMKYRLGGVAMGKPESDEYAQKITTEAQVRAIVKEIH